MTADPARLLGASSSPLARELLGHGKNDAASELVRAAAQRAAEQALTGTLVSGGTTALSSSVLAKWLGAVLVIGAAGTGVALSVANDPPDSPLAVPRAVPSLPELEPRRVPPNAREPESVSFDDLPLAPASSSAQAPGRDSRPSPDRLEREIRILDRGRQALAAGNPALALRELDEHAAELEVLGPEAESLRIEALYASRRDSEATARAHRFLASHGQSPLAARVLSLKNAHEKAHE
ncbi:MAG TPA: hypothetical protein VF103_00135 [Polyangiaceae bacterium]